MTNAKDDNIGSFYMGRGPQPPEPRRVLPRGALTVLALAGFGAVIWYAYPHKKEAYQDIDIPVITADNTPYKFKPEDPGGMEVRHQDSTVFDPLENKSPDTVEKLTPPAEQPMSKDKAVEMARAQDKPATADKTAKAADMEVKTLPDGTEKIITGPAIKSATAVSPHVAAPQVIHPAAGKTAAAVTDAAKADAAKTAEAAKTETAKAEPVKAAVTTAATAGSAIKPDVAATASGVYVQLGAFRDLASAQKEWAALQKKYPQYLSSLTMRTERVDLGAKGVFNRLQAGRVEEADAKKICDALKAGGTAGCIVVH